MVLLLLLLLFRRVQNACRQIANWVLSLLCFVNAGVLVTVLSYLLSVSYKFLISAEKLTILNCNCSSAGRATYLMPFVPVIRNFIFIFNHLSKTPKLDLYYLSVPTSYIGMNNLKQLNQFVAAVAFFSLDPRIHFMF